jgi:hypothetical protein
MTSLSKTFTSFLTAYYEGMVASGVFTGSSTINGSGT